MPGEKLVFHDLGGGHVNLAAHRRVRVVHQDVALKTTRPRVYMHALAGNGQALGTEPQAQLIGIDEGTVDELRRGVEDTREGDFFLGGLSYRPIVIAADSQGDPCPAQAC